MGQVNEFWQGPRYSARGAVREKILSSGSGPGSLIHQAAILQWQMSAFAIDSGSASCYNCHMKLIITLTFLAHALSGCAVYTGVSIGSVVATGKTIGDHGASLVTQADCNAWRASIELTYWCEYLREPGTTYNRNGY